MAPAVDEDIFPDIRQAVFIKCGPAWELPEHKLGSANLTYVIQGEARYTIDGQIYELAQGSLLYLPKNRIVRGGAFSNRPMQCFSVDFDLRGGRAALHNAGLPFDTLSQPGRHEDITHMFHDMAFAWHDRQPAHAIKCRGLFLQIIHRFLELLVLKSAAGAGDSRVTRAVNYIAAHYPERITIKSMAKMAGLHPGYFGALFRAEMGTNLNSYLMQVRVKNAHEMLAGGERKVNDVAEACGFADTSHFYKHFKSIRGFAPSQSIPKKS